MMKGLISCIILTYRNFDGIYDTLDSIMMQEYPEIEIIISDDGSPDADTKLKEISRYIEEHKRDNIKNVIVNAIPQNIGTVRNINQALRLANGEYIKDIPSEDVLNAPDVLLKYKQFLDSSGTLLCCSKVRGVTAEGKIITKLISCEDDYDSLRKMTPEQLCNRLFRRNCLPAPAFFMKKELFEKYGFYPEEIRLIEDYPYWLNLCLQGVRIAFTDERLVDYKLSGVSSGGHYNRMFMDDLMLIYNKYIFPYDHRFGVLQKGYNMLKKGGLKAYIVIADWEKYSFLQKFKYAVLYSPWLVFIKLNDLRFKIK